MGPIGKDEVIGTENSLKQKMLKESLKEKTKGSYHYDPDLLAIDPFIKEKYGDSQGYRLCYQPIQKFRESFDGTVDGYTPVIRDQEDINKTSIFGSPFGEKSEIANQFFVKENLILAKIPIEEYNLRKEYELRQSNERRSMGKEHETANSVYDKVSLNRSPKGVKNQTIFKEQKISDLNK